MTSHRVRYWLCKRVFGHLWVPDRNEGFVLVVTPRTVSRPVLQNDPLTRIVRKAVARSTRWGWFTFWRDELFPPRLTRVQYEWAPRWTRHVCVRCQIPWYTRFEDASPVVPTRWERFCFWLGSLWGRA